MPKLKTNNQISQRLQDLQLEPISRLDVAEKAVTDFPFFVREIFSKSTDIFKNHHWTGGVFIDEISAWLQGNPKTARVSAKDHFKSMSFYAHLMWKIHCLAFNGRRREVHYFSYKESMASYHLAKIKDAVACNPYFSEVIDLKDQAEGKISYTWDGKTAITITPRGLLEFKRGIHCNDIYVDDPLQDPSNKLVPTKVLLVNDIMRTQIIDMPQDELHIAGTPQTTSDFFFDDNFMSRFSRKILPAVVNDSEKKVLWPEWMSYEELMAKKKERGLKGFKQEYLCTPVYSADAYFNEEQIDAVINQKLRNYTMAEWKKEKEKERAEASAKGQEPPLFDVSAGFDIGKKGHPSHFSVFEKRRTKKGARRRIQIHSKWMDHWDYNDQIRYLKEAVENFRIDKLFYDNTRGEFEAFEERGELPPEMVGVPFSYKRKHAMATALDQAVGAKSVEFVNDQRQRNQMLIVTSDLDAPSTPEGHGDSFWSNGLAFCDEIGGEVDISDIRDKTGEREKDDED